MNTLFIVLFWVSAIILIVGLINPPKKKSGVTKEPLTRKQIGITFGIITFICLILVGATGGSSSTPASNSNTPQPTTPTTTSTSSSATTTMPNSATPATASPVAQSKPSNGVNTVNGNLVVQPQAQQTAPTPPSPTASIMANDSANSTTVPYDTAATISWISTNASTCSVSPSGWTGTSGNQSTGNLTSVQVYSLSCSGSGGSASANVKVNVAAKPAPSPITLSGSSQEATQQFTLQQGLSILTLQNSGQQNFIVDLLDSNGNQVDNLANAIGDYTGSQALNISAAGNYLLNVQSDGPWSITITQPRPTSAQSVSNLSGSGDEATQFFNLTSGLHTFTLSNSGSGNFIVDLLDQNGNEVENLENEIGDFNGSTAVHIDSGGIYLLNVISGGIKSSGNWTVQIQ